MRAMAADEVVKIREKGSASAAAGSPSHWLRLTSTIRYTVERCTF